MKTRALMISVMTAGVLSSALPEIAEARTELQMAATTCTPSKDSVLDDVYETGYTVYFPTGVTGTIVLYCWIDNELAEHDNIEVSYNDGDGASSAANVKVQLYTYRKDGTGIVPPILTAFDSNSYASGWANRVVSFSKTYDHEDYFYFLKITMTRTSTSYAASIGHVRLFTVIP